MKVMTILGTRPEIIRLSCVIERLDQFSEHILVHTGQNFDDRLSRLFFEQLGVRQPNEMMNVRASSFAGQVGQIIEKAEQLCLAHRPDRVLVLGDTNSGLAAIVARRLGIPVYHMEAGNRCFDDRVPEEVNRRVIDHSSSVLLPYTNRSKENLVREGIALERIFVTGNPIKEVIEKFAPQIRASKICADLRVEEKKYFLVTMHRAENVDIPERLKGLVSALTSLHARYGFPVICSFHPRTRAKVKEFGIDIERQGVHFVEPLGFFDFVHLEQRAFCVLSDSGTVQEEACLFGVANVTIRDVTERPETVECGSNVLSGGDEKQILELVELVTRSRNEWTPPAEYLATNVSDTVARIVLGYRMPDLAELKWRGQA